MHAGHVIAIFVLAGVFLSFLIDLPGWLPMVLIGALAVALLVSGVVVFRRGPVA